MKQTDMKQKAKLVLILAVLFLVILAVYQNAGLFTLRKSLRLDLFFTRFQTGEIANGIFLLIAFATGFLVAYFFNLSRQLKSRRSIRQLKVEAEEKNGTIKALQREIEALKSAAGRSPQAPPRPPVETNR